MRAFHYSRPGTIAAALSALKENPEARLLAGGQSLLAALKLRLAAPSLLIDLQDIADLRGIRVMGDRISIGAMSTHAEVANHSQIGAVCPALAQLAGGIGDRMIRNLGTIGGSVVNNDPAADYPAAMLALDAVMVTNTRRIAAAQFVGGLYETALAPDEILLSIEITAPRRAFYIKFKQPASRFAMVGVMVAQTSAGTRVAVTGAAAGAFRVEPFERALQSKFEASALEGLAVAADTLNNDLHASAEYRAHLISVLARRAVAAAANER
jgi:carbon-monoxide dehydrogenase medium subunit